MGTDRASARTMGQHAGNKGLPPRVHPHGLLGVEGGREAGSRVSGGSFGKRRGEDDGRKEAFWQELGTDGCGRSTRLLWVFFYPTCLIHTQTGADFEGGTLFFVSSCIFKWVYDNLGLFLIGIRHIYLPITKTNPLITGYTTNHNITGVQIKTHLRRETRVKTRQKCK